MGVCAWERNCVVVCVREGGLHERVYVGGRLHGRVDKREAVTWVYT